MKLHVTTNQFHARFPLSAISGFSFRRFGSVLYSDSFKTDMIFKNSVQHVHDASLYTLKYLSGLKYSVLPLFVKRKIVNLRETK